MRNGKNGHKENFSSLAEKKSVQAHRYLNNAKEMLDKVPVQYGLYQDTKYVSVACGTVYLGVVRAFESYLIRHKKLSHKTLPEGWDEIKRMLKTYTNGNGKIIEIFGVVYEILHVQGYYKDLRVKVAIEDAFDKAGYLINEFCNNCK